MKPADVSEIKIGISESKIYELATNSKNMNITDLYRRMD
jgi:hypothetical protein